MGRFLFTDPPSEQEAADWGLTQEEACGGFNEVFPDNWEAVLLFGAIRTQWRVGMGGAVGLDYNVLYHKLDRMRLTPERYEELEAEIMVLESGALAGMRESG